MRAELLSIFLLTFFVFLKADSLKNDQELDWSSDESLFIRRYFMNEDLALQERDTIEFDDAHRKFQNDAVAIHNKLRARHCVQPLVLDEDINIRSQIYAEKLASTDGPLKHSTNRGAYFGENLYSLTRKSPIKSLPAEKVVMAWYSEIQIYNYSDPVYSRTTGHFTQIVWKDTERFGIGYASAREGRKIYVVAQYGPPGNYEFSFPENVLEPAC